MTLKEFRELTKDMPEDTILQAYDHEEALLFTVTASHNAYTEIANRYFPTTDNRIVLTLNIV